MRALAAGCILHRVHALGEAFDKAHECERIAEVWN